jgi:hypothetical protein
VCSRLVVFYRAPANPPLSLQAGVP